MIDRSQFKATSMFLIYKDVIQDELKMVLRYLENVGDNFDRQTSELSGVSYPELDGGAQAAYEELYFQNAVHFPSILKASILVSLYTVLEKTLRLAVTRAESFLLIQNHLKKKRNESDTAYYFRVLTTVYDFEIGTATLEKLNEFREIRNAFVHSGGNMRFVKPEKKPVIEKIIEGSNEMLLVNEQTKEIIIHNEQYVVRFAQEQLSLFAILFDHLADKYYAIANTQTNPTER